MAEKHGNNWRTNFRLDGKRVRVPLGSLDDLTKDEADAAEALVKEQMERDGKAGSLVPISRLGVYGRDEASATKKKWDDLLSSIEGEVAQQKGTSILHALIDQREIKFAPIKADRTGKTGYRFYNAIIRAVAMWAEKYRHSIPDITEIDKHALLELYRFVYERGDVKHATVWVNYLAPTLAAAKALSYDRDVEFAHVDTGWIRHRLGRIYPDFTTKKDKAGKRVTKEAYTAFAEHASEVVADITLFLALTGMRKANGVEAKWSELVPDASGNMYLRAAVKSKIDRMTGKRTKVLEIVIPPRAMALVEKYRGKHADAIWVNLHGDPMGYQNYSNAFFTAQAKLPKGDRFRIHDLRHTFATRVGSRLGGEKAQNAVGHEDISTTRRYMHRDEGFHGAITSAIGDLWESEAA